MIVLVECTFFLPDVHSLKEKRAVLQRMIQRVKNRYNVSIAEIDHQDLWQRATLAVVAVSSSKEYAEKEVDRTVELLESAVEWERTEYVRFYY